MYMKMEIKEMSNSKKNNEKIGKVLQKFLDPNFKISNDAYLNSFLTHLVGKNGNSKIWQSDTQLKEQFCQWVIEVSTLWEHKKVNPPGPILSFALSLTGELSADEQIFVRLNGQNVYERLVGVAVTNSTEVPSAALELVNLLCSFLEHKSGLQWIMATTYWTNVINLGLKALTTYIRKKAHQFVIKLLEKTIRFNQKFAVRLVEVVLKPIKTALQNLPIDENAQNILIEDSELFESLRPSLEMILEIVESLFKTYNRQVLHLFVVQETSETIKKLYLLSKTEEFSFILLQILFVFLFYSKCERFKEAKGVTFGSLSIIESKTMFNLIKNEMDKNAVRCVVKICNYLYVLICSLAPHVPICTKEETIFEFEMHVIFFQLTPIYAFSRQIVSESRLQFILTNDVFRKDYIRRRLKMGSSQLLTIGFKWIKRLVMKTDLVDDVIFCLQNIVKTKNLLDKERTATIFPPCVYNLADAMSYVNERPGVEVSSSWSLYFRTVIDTIVDLVESFDLTWKDSIETIHVMDLAYDFLQYPHWTENIIIIKGLKLLNTAISKYMSPDMVLLIYNKEDSKVSQTGSLLYAKCHDSCWEIRDSALKVVFTLSLNANTKFPAYTNILLNAELPQLVVKMALKDGEHYVRATAIRCLQELIQIPEIWKKLIDINTFFDNILDVFENETEGIVRKEAAALIYKIDKHQSFPKELLPRLYNVMIYAAIEDIHWEVKYNALDFWFNLWEQHLVQEGMIDQTFPSHTFSKELKKIVALNEAEVRKRIIKVLNQLSHIGCLHVMKCAIQDDSNIEVSKKATSFTFNILKMFKIYKISSENVDTSQSPSPTVIQKYIPNQQLFEPNLSTSGNILPSDFIIESTGPFTPSMAPFPRSLSNESLGGLEFAMSSFFDPLSLYPAPFSPFLDLEIMTSPAAVALQTSATRNSPEQNRTQDRNFMDGQDIAISGTEPNASISNMPASDIFNFNLSNGMDESGLSQLENTVTNKTTQMKTNSYLAPSDYLNFVYNELETLATHKKQRLNSLDEFDSLLDDILKEDNISGDVNNRMDCY